LEADKKKVRRKSGRVTAGNYTGDGEKEGVPEKSTPRKKRHPGQRQ